MNASARILRRLHIQSQLPSMITPPGACMPYEEDKKKEGKRTKWEKMWKSRDNNHGVQSIQ